MLPCGDMCTQLHARNPQNVAGMHISTWSN